MSQRFAATLVACLALATTTGASEPQTSRRDWTQWRGPSRDGQVAGAPWPRRLSASGLEKRWRVELGPSYSGPLVVGNRVFTTETKGRQYEVVRALVSVVKTRLPTTNGPE